MYHSPSMPWHASLAAVLVTALAQPAVEPGPEVGSMPLRLPQDVSKPDKNALQRRFSEGIARSGLQATRVGASCDDAECYQSAGEGAGVSLLVGGTVERTGPDYTVEVYAVDAGSGQVVAKVDGLCEICGVGELGDVVGNLAARLRPALESTIQPTTLVVESDPSGAQVWIDGEEAGTTPLEIAVTPGPHEIDVVGRGRRSEHVEAELRPGVTKTFSFRLAKTSRLPPWAPWVVLGGGTASLAAGIGLLVIDEDPIRNDCNADVDGNCEFLYDTVAGGVVLTVTGVALVGTGVGLLIAQSRQGQRRTADSARRRPPRAASLRLVPGLGGASIVGRF